MSQAGPIAEVITLLKPLMAAPKWVVPAPERSLKRAASIRVLPCAPCNFWSMRRIAAKVIAQGGIIMPTTELEMHFKIFDRALTYTRAHLNAISGLGPTGECRACSFRE